PERQAGPPRGLAPSSMFRRGNLAPAIRNLQRRTNDARVQLVTLDAEKLFVTAVRGRSVMLATQTWEGETTLYRSDSGPSAASTFPWSRLDPSAPNRIVRAATRGRSPSAIENMVLLDPAGPFPLSWSVFLRNGDQYNASPDGRRVEKIG
ncbi:MAG: hypothetical protein M3389_05195, partial [Actinomycetota bacterium]|nr:hypothetical protein [Actinomycetota bacterium]